MPWNWARGQKKGLELNTWAAELAFPFWPLIWVCLQEFTPPLSAAGQSSLLLPPLRSVGWPSLTSLGCSISFCLVFRALLLGRGEC